ncbi:hypothetical protein, partial [Streptomyces clavuligerus]|uniref:hypothetical protein n=1 Tax=Streptomyces clavuligerus TaxID=1901 RepID=UPI0018CFFEA8
LGSRSAGGGGGRYDGLSEMLGGPALPSVAVRWSAHRAACSGPCRARARGRAAAPGPAPPSGGEAEERRRLAEEQYPGLLRGRHRDPTPLPSAKDGCRGTDD